MIFVDFREERSGILQVLSDLNVQYKKITLEVGDYVVTGIDGTNVCIERKTASDYVNSLVSGHLNNQLVQMSRNYPFSVLLVEGSVSGALLDSGVSRSAVYSSLVGSFLKRSPSDVSGVINILPVDTIWDTGLVLKFIEQKLVSEKGLIRLPKLNPLKFSEEEAVLCMLTTVPGVGTILAKSILNKFHNLQNVANASIGELMEIKKVGKTKATKIFEFFRFYFNSTKSNSTHTRAKPT